MSGKYILVGNGVNMQFGGRENSSQQIVLRVLKNCDEDDYPVDIVIDEPFLLKNYIGKLFIEARDILRNKYDQFTTCDAERESLSAFKKRYISRLSNLRIPDICFEDYYLVHDLLCHKMGMLNPEQYTVREAMRVAYLYAIYNHGMVNSIYLQYPQKFKDYLCSFDKVFTTNYDSNLDMCIKKQVVHLHGAFDTLGDVYEAKSLRNFLPDAPLLDARINTKYSYLYCNALTTHCGEYKDFMVHQISQANKGIRRFAEAYTNDPAIKKTIDGWTKDVNRLVSNLGRAVQIVVLHPDIQFIDNYHFDEFETLAGELEILGLSPQNDTHLFKTINSLDIDMCTYYYFSEQEVEDVRLQLDTLSSNGHLRFASVKEFWKSYE